VLRRSLETTLELSCEAPFSPGFVSFNSLFGGVVDPPTMLDVAQALIGHDGTV
jgi:hypothetical protein